MQMKRGIIFAGGEFSTDTDIKDILTNDSVILCADSGYDNALLCGICPDVIIGDMDSVQNKLPDGVRQIKLNPEKDDTDTQACIDFLADEGCGEIILLGALGGRIDHQMANIMLTIYAAKKGVKLVIKDGKTEMFAVENSAKIKGEAGDWLSLIPILGDVEGVSLSGLKYTLENARLEAGKTVGISNEFVNETAEISLKKGLILAVKTKR